MAETSYNLKVGGRVSLSERGERNEKDNTWGSKDLAWADVDGLEVGVSLGYDDEEDYGKGTVCIELSDYHVPNEDGSRAFHARLAAYISLDEAKVLRAYLGFLIDNHGT